MTKKALKNLVAKGKTEELIVKLLSFEKVLKTESFNEILLLSGRLRGIKQDFRKGITSPDIFQREKNIISNSLVELIDTINFNSPKNVITKENHFTSIKTKIELIIQDCWDFYFEIANREIRYDWEKKLKDELEHLTSKWDNQKFQVAIIALMKSGKSTLLNALIGEEYLPSATLAETMKIVRISHNPKLLVGTLYEGEKKLKSGAVSIKKFLRKENEKARKEEAEYSDELRLEVKFTSLQNRTLNEYKFDILDTPGTNEAGVSTLKSHLEILLNSTDVIVYVLDYTKLASNDEKQILANLKKWRNDLINHKDRIFFVVNKIDITNRHDRERKLEPTKVAKYVSELISKELEIKIDPKKVIPLSAEKALLGRLVESKKATFEQLQDFKLKACGEVYSEVVTDQQCIEFAPNFIEKSGLPILEKNILDVIYKKRAFIFFGSIIDDLERYFSQLSRNLSIAKGVLQTDKVEVGKLKRKITNIKKGVDVFDKKEEFKTKAQKKIDKTFADFKKKVETGITAAFSLDESAVQTNFFPKFITDKLRLTRYNIQSKDIAAVESNLVFTHKIIFNYIDSEFKSVWHEVINGVYEEYENLKEEISKKITPLVRKIEQEINETLSIDLRPARIRPFRLNQREFQQKLIDDIQFLVKEKTKFKIHKTKVNLNFFGFNIQIPWLNLFEKSFYASSKDYEDFLLDAINPIIENSSQIAKQAIETNYINIIENAKEELENSTIKYIDIMETEIDRKQNGVDILERIKTITEDYKKVEKILSLLEKNRIEFLKTLG